MEHLTARDMLEAEKVRTRAKAKRMLEELQYRNHQKMAAKNWQSYRSLIHGEMD